MATLSDVAKITVSKNRDETINGNIMFNGLVNSNHRNANTAFYGYDGSDYSLVGLKREGSGIEIFGSESANNARWVRLRSSDDSTYWSDLDIRRDGVYFNYQPIIRLIESWKSGENWYRKYSDGFIEQGGLCAGYSGQRNSVVSFHTSFTSIPNVQKTFITISDAHGFLAKAVGLYSKPTTTSFEVNYVYGETDWFMWYACGY